MIGGSHLQREFAMMRVKIDRLRSWHLSMRAKVTKMMLWEH